MDINIYFNRKSAIDNDPPKVIRNVTRSNVSLVDNNRLIKYTVGDLEWFGFDHELLGPPDHPHDDPNEDPNEAMVLVSMLLPSYFQETGREIHGHFLIPIGVWSVDKDLSEPSKFFGDKAIGRFGCPRPIVPNSKGYFSFNNQRFHPFVMTDFSTGYFVCDEPAHHGDVPEWKPYNPAIPVHRKRGVALDYPVAYDPTLGLYITRVAHLVP